MTTSSQDIDLLCLFKAKYQLKQQSRGKRDVTLASRFYIDAAVEIRIPAVTTD